jgi:hypothetical protein
LPGNGCKLKALKTDLFSRAYAKGHVNHGHIPEALLGWYLMLAAQLIQGWSSVPMVPVGIVLIGVSAVALPL